MEGQPEALLGRNGHAGRSQELVLLFYGSWLHRGYASQHGISALIDVTTGCILFLKHESKDKSKFGREPHKKSSGMMEVVALEKSLAEAEEMDVNISRMVADADAGIRSVAAKHGIPLARCRAATMAVRTL